MAWLTSLLSASFMASAKFASALLRVIWAIFSLSDRKPLLAVCELVSSVFHVRSLVAAKVSNARFVLLDADLHQIAKRIRHFWLHERVICHDTLLSSQLTLECRVLAAATHQTLHGSELTTARPLSAGDRRRAEVTALVETAERCGLEFGICFAKRPDLLLTSKRERNRCRVTGRLTTRLIVSEPRHRFLRSKKG